VVVLDALTHQITELAEAFPGSAIVLLPDGSHVVEVPIALPSGWSRDRVTARFVVPIPYPVAQLDCFYVDADLCLAGGAPPTNTGFQPLDGQNYLWFSWHLARWDPTRDSLLTFARFINERLRRVQ
jgi:hypothetical protein